jgi:DNA-binding CsgD family transcriptional regulator
MVKCSKAQVRRLKTALRGMIPVTQRQRIQMVLLRESGMTQPAIAAAMGVSLSTVNRAHMAYDQGGLKARSSPSRMAGASQTLIGAFNVTRGEVEGALGNTRAEGILRVFSAAC